MNKIIMILSCALSNFLSRVLPQFISALDHLPRKVKKAMILLPVAALGALIFPFALTDFGPSWYAGLLGIIVAFISGYKKLPMIISIILALITAVILLSI